jgi:hypothetical protein
MKAAGTFRVVLLGDSFIEGYAIALEQRVGSAPAVAKLGFEHTNS